MMLAHWHCSLALRLMGRVAGHAPLHWHPTVVLNYKMKDASSDSDLISCARSATCCP